MSNVRKSWKVCRLRRGLSAKTIGRGRILRLQNVERGVGSTDYEEVLADIIRRDEIDSTRAASPLVAADDAVHIDSSDLTLQEVVARICTLARSV